MTKDTPDRSKAADTASEPTLVTEIASGSHPVTMTADELDARTFREMDELGRHSFGLPPWAR